MNVNWSDIMFEHIVKYFTNVNDQSSSIHKKLEFKMYIKYTQKENNAPTDKYFYCIHNSEFSTNMPFDMIITKIYDHIDNNFNLVIDESSFITIDEYHAEIHVKDDPQDNDILVCQGVRKDDDDTITLLSQYCNEVTIFHNKVIMSNKKIKIIINTKNIQKVLEQICFSNIQYCVYRIRYWELMKLNNVQNINFENAILCVPIDLKTTPHQVNNLINSNTIQNFEMNNIDLIDNIDVFQNNHHISKLNINMDFYHYYKMCVLLGKFSKLDTLKIKISHKNVQGIHLIDHYVHLLCSLLAKNTQLQLLSIQLLCFPCDLLQYLQILITNELLTHLQIKCKFDKQSKYYSSKKQKYFDLDNVMELILTTSLHHLKLGNKCIISIHNFKILLQINPPITNKIYFKQLKIKSVIDHQYLIDDEVYKLFQEYPNHPLFEYIKSNHQYFKNTCRYNQLLSSKSQ